MDKERLEQAAADLPPTVGELRARVLRLEAVLTTVLAGAIELLTVKSRLKRGEAEKALVSLVPDDCSEVLVLVPEVRSRMEEETRPRRAPFPFGVCLLKPQAPILPIHIVDP